jgi:hypothetical protein
VTAQPNFAQLIPGAYLQAHHVPTESEALIELSDFLCGSDALVDIERLWSTDNRLGIPHHHWSRTNVLPLAHHLNLDVDSALVDNMSL